MIYNFALFEYYDVIEELDKKYESIFDVLKQIKIAENEDSELYVYGMRIKIPTIGISVRVGMEYDPSEDEEESEGIESFVVYGEDETDPNEFLESNCNIGFTGMVAMFAKRKGLSAEEIEKLECFTDESEFVFWD